MKGVASCLLDKSKMILEYLLGSDADADACLNIVTEADVEKKKKKISDSCYIVTVSIDSNSREAARTLSDINEKIVPVCKSTVLTNGSAAYYNRELFPYINVFERKLRKLLYAASSLKPLRPEDEGAISNLEDKDFGTIFDALFRDQKYWDRVKAFVNGKNRGWTGYSSELNDYLKAESEDLLWDRLLPNQVPALRESFAEVRLRRNDIMHAHNISRLDYSKTQKLFMKINREIDEAIEGLADGAFIPESYNTDLMEAITSASIYNGEYEVL